MYTVTVCQEHVILPLAHLYSVKIGYFDPQIIVKFRFSGEKIAAKQDSDSPLFFFFFSFLCLLVN